jgi:uncharacterized protein (TIGR03118 family)
MKTTYWDLRIQSLLTIAVWLLLVNTGCQKTTDAAVASDQNVSNAQAKFSFGNFAQVNLNANTQGYHAPHINPKLHNAWGMSASPGGTFWISAADGGVTFVYNNKGVQQIPAVAIPSHIAGAPGNPTGQVFNGTPDFVIANTGSTAKFIFASEDGTVSGWNGGPSAVIVADRAGSGAKYTGIDIANDGGANYLYVANFTEHKVDVFDKDFNYVSGKPFTDPNIPADYAPFNIKAINNMLYVTYAFVSEDGEDSTGASLGYVDVYWPNGMLSKRLATQGTLNAPWGVAQASPELIGMDGLLVGNFGDGRINVFDWDGNFKGQLMTSTGPVEIEGLWAIDNSIAKTGRRQLYFTAGPEDEEDGIFGFLFKL